MSSLEERVQVMENLSYVSSYGMSKSGFMIGFRVWTLKAYDSNGSVICEVSEKRDNNYLAQQFQLNQGNRYTAQRLQNMTGLSHAQDRMVKAQAALKMSLAPKRANDVSSDTFSRASTLKGPKVKSAFRPATKPRANVKMQYAYNNYNEADQYFEPLDYNGRLARTNRYYYPGWDMNGGYGPYNSGYGWGGYYGGYPRYGRYNYGYGANYYSPYGYGGYYGGRQSPYYDGYFG